MKTYYCFLAASADAVAAAQAVAAEWGVNAVWAPVAIYDDTATKTEVGFDASLPLPGPHVLMGADREITWDEWIALEALGLTISNHPNAPGLLGYDERVTVAPEEPIPEPEPEPEPEPDPMLYGFVEQPAEDQPEA